MEITNLLEAKNRLELREWLSKNHQFAKECWVNVKRGRPKDDTTFWYIDAVEEAMCFGWIDSTIKKLDTGITIQRLAPRSKRSNWSELNKSRCRHLIQQGLMKEAGFSVLPDLDPNKFQVDPEILDQLQADEIVWQNFQNFPDLYRRIRIDTIQVVRKDRTTYEKRLEKLVSNTRKNKMYG